MPDYIVTVEYERIERVREHLVVRGADSAELAIKAVEFNFQTCAFDRADLEEVYGHDLRKLVVTGTEPR